MEPYASIDMPWFNVLGNHDYHSTLVAEEWGERLRALDSRWICQQEYTIMRTVAPPGGEPFTVQFFFIDTSPLVGKYQKELFVESDCLDNPLPGDEDDCDAHYNGLKMIEPAMALKLRSAARGPTSREEKQAVWDAYTAQRMLKLSESLRHSDARWKIVVGHHALYSQGDHGDEADELKAALLPVLEEHGVPLWLNGAIPWHSSRTDVRRRSLTVNSILRASRCEQQGTSTRSSTSSSRGTRRTSSPRAAAPRRASRTRSTGSRTWTGATAPTRASRSTAATR